MADHWTLHMQNYDLLQGNFSEYQELVDFIVRSLQDCKRVLDVGAGTGIITQRLLQLKISVTALDSNSSALHLLEKKCRDMNGLTIIQHDAALLPFSEKSFDGIASGLVLYNFVNPKKHLAECYRVLEEKGHLAITNPLPHLDVAGLMERNRVELTKKGILPKANDAFDELLKTTQKNEEILKKNTSSESELVSMLNDTGFQITAIRKTYRGGMISLSAKKG